MGATISSGTSLPAGQPPVPGSGALPPTTVPGATGGGDTATSPSATLPATAATAAPAATTGGSASDATAGASLAGGSAPTMQLLAIVTSLVGVLVGLLSLQAAQGAPAVPTGGTTPATPDPSTSGGGGGAPTQVPSPVQQSPVQQVPVTQGGGGGAAAGAPSAAPTTMPGMATTPATTGGGALGAPTATTTTASVPATTTAPALTGPAAVATILPKYLSGTPAPGGQLATIMAGASTQAMPAKTEDGVWTWVADGSGAQAFIHVHGSYWPQHLDQLGWAVQNGYLMPHVHPDGSLHLHDT